MSNGNPFRVSPGWLRRQLGRLRRVSLRHGGFAVVVLVAAYLASALWVGVHTVRHTAEEVSAKHVIRVAHNLAEPAIIAALKDLARKYEAQNPGTRVYIQSIPDRAYQQWVTTQLVGDTAPDIIATGNPFDGMWESLASRYMVPLSLYVNRPNPYVKDPKLVGVPWRRLYRDNMEGGYWRHLTEYYSVPLNIETSRIFYNKDLLTKATGSDAPPRNLSELFDDFDAIRRYAREHHRKLYPLAVAGSANAGQLSNLLHMYYAVLADGISDPYDTTYWGFGGPDATLTGLYRGTFSFKDEPRILATFHLIRKMAQSFQPGFISADKAQTRFLFTQGRAAMVLGSARDLGVFQSMTQFDVGAFHYPIPEPSYPVLGKMVTGPIMDTSSVGLSFGVNRSGDVDRAIDFLMFCTAPANNQAFNAKVKWFPAIRDARPAEDMAVFEPVTEGAGRRLMPFRVNPDVSLWFDQNFPQYLTGRIGLDHFLDQLKQQWLTEGIRDVLKNENYYQQRMPTLERAIARDKARLLFKEAGRPRAGQLVGDRTGYELTLEVAELLKAGIAQGRYVWQRVLDKQGADDHAPATRTGDAAP